MVYNFEKMLFRTELTALFSAIQTQMSHKCFGVFFLW